MEVGRKLGAENTGVDARVHKVRGESWWEGKRKR